MAGPYLPIQALNRSQAVRIGQGASAVELVAGTTAYVDTSNSYVKRDLQRHSSIGSYMIVGPLTNSNSDWVVFSGGVVTAGSGLSVTVSAGELLKRSTAAYKAGASATSSALTDSTAGGQSIIYLVSWHQADGTVVLTAGTAATTGQQVAPATPTGNTPLATVLFAHGASVPGTITDVRPRP